MPLLLEWGVLLSHATVTRRLYNPLAQFLVAATKQSPDAQGDCGWVVKVTQGTEEALQQAYPGSQDTKGTKANTCGTLDDLCCNPKACDCFPGKICHQPKPSSLLLE